MPHFLLYVKKQVGKDLLLLKEPVLIHQIPSSLLNNSLYGDFFSLHVLQRKAVGAFL